MTQQSLTSDFDRKRINTFYPTRLVPIAIFEELMVSANPLGTDKRDP